MRDPRFLVVFGACLTQFTVIGLWFSYGLFFKEFETEFGWSRTLLSACSAIAIFMMGMLAMPAGRLSDRFGPRRVLAVSGLAYGLAFVLLAGISAPWQLIAIFGTLAAIGFSTHDVVTLGTVARWFHKRRGIMSGVVKVGTAAGQVTVPLVAAALIAGLGWRQALVVLGIAAGVLLLVAALSMRAPEDPAQPSGAPARTGASYAEARASGTFWKMCAIQFLFFPAIMTVPLHLPVHAMDLGMSKTGAAGLLSVIGGASVAGRLIVGGLSDRIGGRKIYAICLMSVLAALIGFCLTTEHAALYAVVVLYGFGHGGYFTAVSPTVAEFFGMRAHGAIFGSIVFFGTIGGSVGPILAGLAFDLTGSYLPAFITLAVACGLALGLALGLTPQQTPQRA